VGQFAVLGPGQADAAQGNNLGGRRQGGGVMRAAPGWEAAGKMHLRLLRRCWGRRGPPDPPVRGRRDRAPHAVTPTQKANSEYSITTLQRPLESVVSP
jgi:hypothetical protein